MEFGGALHLEYLVWPRGIERADEGIEAVLLLHAVEAPDGRVGSVDLDHDDCRHGR